MKPKTISVAILAVLLVLSSVDAETITITAPAQKPAENISVPIGPTETNVNSSDQPAESSKPEEKNDWVWEASLFVNKGSEEYFYAQVFSRNTTIEIVGIDSDLEQAQVSIKKENPVKIISWFKNYILVKEVKNSSQTVQTSSQNITIQTVLGYYLYELKIQGHGSAWLQATQLFINPYTDDSSFTLPKSFVLTDIVELDEQNQFMYVAMRSLVAKQTIIYKIDLANRGSTLIATSWWKDEGKTIIGGNHKVFVDMLNSQFLIYEPTPNTGLVEESKFLAKNYSEITSLSIFKDTVEIIQFVGSYFYFTSASTDLLTLNGFLYRGYGDHPISGQAEISTKSEFSFLLDNYNFFIVVGSDNMLWVEVFENKTTNSYQNYTLSLVESIRDESTQKSILTDFKSVSRVFYEDNQVYGLTSEKFFIYLNNQSVIQKVYEIAVSLEPVTQKLSESDSTKIQKQASQIKAKDLATQQIQQTASQEKPVLDLDQGSVKLMQEMKKYHELTRSKTVETDQKI